MHIFSSELFPADSAALAAHAGFKNDEGQKYVQTQIGILWSPQCGPS